MALRPSRASKRVVKFMLIIAFLVVLVRDAKLEAFRPSCRNRTLWIGLQPCFHRGRSALPTSTIVTIQET